GRGLTRRIDRRTLGHLRGSREESDDFLAPMRLNLGCSAPSCEPSGPNAVTRLSQGIRPSTALRPFAGPSLWRNASLPPRNPDPAAAWSTPCPKSLCLAFHA